MNADELIQRRAALGLSAPALARKLGVAESTVWRWEQGRPMLGLARRRLEATLTRLERQAKVRESNGTGRRPTPAVTPASRVSPLVRARAEAERHRAAGNDSEAERWETIADAIAAGMAEQDRGD